MFVGKTVTANEHNFLASSKFISFTTMVDDTNAAVTTDELGHKIIPAGTILPTNDANAKGILLDEIDVNGILIGAGSGHGIFIGPDTIFLLFGGGVYNMYEVIKSIGTGETW